MFPIANVGTTHYQDILIDNGDLSASPRMKSDQEVRNKSRRGSENAEADRSSGTGDDGCRGGRVATSTANGRSRASRGAARSKTSSTSSGGTGGGGRGGGGRGAGHGRLSLQLGVGRADTAYYLGCAASLVARDL